MMEKTVLVIDDDPAACDVLASALRQSLGVRVLTCSTCEEGLVVLEEVWPVLVLVDSQKACPECMAMIRRLRGTSHARRTPILALSAESVGPRVASAAGCDAVLPKPFNLNSLVGTVGDFIGVRA
jgi:DNA-binding response OmpR family regulator